MSDIKRQRIEKVNQRIESKKRSSFDERVCDDLCEVLLQYLPFEDKFRLECVSKQFQRNVFNRQFELVLDNTLYYRLRKKGSRRIMTFIGTAFETIVKKCPNIKTIDLMSFYYYSSHQKTFGLKYNKIVDIIIENCDHLKKFELYVNKLSPKKIDNFCQKFATKLSSIRLSNSNEFFDKQLLTSLSNITDLSLKTDFDWIYCRLSNLFDDNNQCLVRNLRRLSIKYLGNDLEHLVRVIESNPHLKNVDLMSDQMDQLSVCQLLSQISNLSDLREMQICTEYHLTDSSVAKSLKLMAKKCPNLKKIYFKIRVHNENIGLVLEVIDSLKHFKQLKRIRLCLWCQYNYEWDGQTLISAKHFNGFKELTHLSLYSIEGNDSFFKDIGTHLPGLTFLHISNSSITESTLEELAQLKYIQKLLFNQKFHFHPISRRSIAQMYVKCPKLKRISIN